jgi:hypothetical protein
MFFIKNNENKKIRAQTCWFDFGALENVRVRGVASKSLLC